jgi:predicted O-methyltransferase YrrM
MVAFDAVAEAVKGVPYTSTAQGWALFQHVRRTGAREILELGCAHGVGACYLAGAISGEGRVTTVDHVDFIAGRVPHPRDVIERAGLSDRVDLVLVEDSSYAWWLKDQVVARSDANGNTRPLYDFVYLDGAHNLTIDGLAVVLVEKLLKPGGWLLVDDLSWTYAETAGQPWFQQLGLRLSAAEIAEPHMRAVFDLIVRPHPSFTETRVENDWWGWAHKDPTAPLRHLEVTRRRPLGYLAHAGLARIGGRRPRRR